MVEHRPPSSRLLAPIALGPLRLANRLVKAAQRLGYADPDGAVNDRVVAAYEALARGGVGLIAIGRCACDTPTAGPAGGLRLDDDAYLPGMRRLAEAIHAHDVPVVAQLDHVLAEPFDALAPARLEQLVERFAAAARRAGKAGLDGVELRALPDGVLHASLCAAHNRRQDAWGGDADGRARLATEVVRAVRAALGPEAAVGVKLVAAERGHVDARARDEAIDLARRLEAAGASYLLVSAGGYGVHAGAAWPELPRYPAPPAGDRAYAARLPRAAVLPAAEAIRTAVSLPVGVVGHLDLAAAEAALAKDRVDFVALGRPLLADPELPSKLAAGRAERIRPCVRCNLCLHAAVIREPVRCRMNARLGAEAELVYAPAERAKHVMVVGAGPAGLEAARVAALRGHHVMLYDKAPGLGGLMPMAALIKGEATDDIAGALDYYARELDRLGVEVHLAREVDVELVELLAPDAVVLATGGVPRLPGVAGIERAHVTSTADLHAHAARYLHLLGSRMMRKLSKLYVPVGKRVAILGGDLVGLELAEFFISRGREVTVVGEAPELGAGMPRPWRDRLVPWLSARGCACYAGATCREVTEAGVLFDSAEGEPHSVDADTVLVVAQRRENPALVSAIAPLVPEVRRVGEAAGGLDPSIMGAIHSGARVGARL